ncbi:MAG: hypothetical protein IT381_12360 [Deltaproteobacteria bacterium]|nr:hypothetical protein [Deltaproteobacteria bacterium]
MPLVLFVLLAVDPASAAASTPASEPVAIPALTTSADDCPTRPTLLPKLSACALTPPQAIVLRVTRVALEAVLGVAMGAPAEISGAYIGLTLDVVAGHEVGAGLPVGLVLGAALGVAPGVWLGGYAMGGDGSFGWTLLGSTAGTGLSAIILAIKAVPGTLALAALFPVFGAVLGYELSSPVRRAPREKKALVIMPTFSPTSLGIAGVF